jgi:hypothetical protein
LPYYLFCLLFRHDLRNPEYFGSDGHAAFAAAPVLSAVLARIDLRGLIRRAICITMAVTIEGNAILVAD